jgi:hypothetical protein
MTGENLHGYASTTPIGSSTNRRDADRLGEEVSKSDAEQDDPQ